MSAAPKTIGLALVALVTLAATITAMLVGRSTARRRRASHRRRR